MSDTFSNVDTSPDVAGALAWQDRIAAWPQVRAYKQRSYELMGDRGPRLDVGAGTGTDALALTAIACDPSIAMCRAASERGVSTCRGDAHNLPFADHAFGGVRTDRVLQHVGDPARAVTELVRVTAPGGRVVACEPDQETLVIELPGVRPELLARIKGLRRDVGYRNGTLARALPAMFTSAGLRDVSIEGFPLVLTDPDEAFGLPGWARYWRSACSEDDIAEWEAGVARSREDSFVYALLYFVIAGTRA